jgi:DNA polymerase I
MAMLRVDELLAERKLRARMLLQVHDELLFEAPEDEAEAIRALARETMSAVATFKVPLKVDVGVGHSWSDAH